MTRWLGPAETRTMAEKTTFLVLICLNLTDPGRTLGGHRHESAQTQLPRMEEEKQYCLLAGILDPTQHNTATPLGAIPFTPAKKKLYNRILERLEYINNEYYKKDGFVARPHRFTEDAKGQLLDLIGAIGRSIYDLFEGPSTKLLRKWIEDLLGTSEASKSSQRARHHVTIITNDFNIPWYWMKSWEESPLLCEACSLGMLQLGNEAVKHETDRGWQLEVQASNLYSALLINGSPALPFGNVELDTIQRVLCSDPERGSGRNFRFQVERLASVQELYDLRERFPEEGQMTEQFKIVHFTGHYSEKSLTIGEKPVQKRLLDQIVDGSVLVLDGCSSSQGLNAWTDVKGVTNELINLGALGCVVTVLPVKHDPVVSEVLWSAFYAALRSGGASSVGRALADARRSLKEHFQRMDSRNPAWALYQLIGNPAVRLFDPGATTDE
jgi:hypothetical protein